MKQSDSMILLYSQLNTAGGHSDTSVDTGNSHMELIGYNLPFINITSLEMVLILIHNHFELYCSIRLEITFFVQLIYLFIYMHAIFLLKKYS